MGKKECKGVAKFLLLRGKLFTKKDCTAKTNRCAMRVATATISK